MVDLLRKLKTAKLKLHDALPVVPAVKRLSDKIVLVDVGASKGIQRKWLPYKRSITPVLFEPNPDEAEALRASLSGYANAKIVECGLSDKAGTYTLNIGRSYGCTSMLQANMDFLKDYEVAQWYRSEKTAEVNCARYDDLVTRGSALKPDVMKIDIEGYESRALDGFGNLLADVLGIETEAWFYEALKGQALLHQLVEKLDGFGLRLRRLETVPGFEGDLVCVNAYFTMPRKRYQTLSPNHRAKFDVMSKVWRLEAYI